MDFGRIPSSLPEVALQSTCEASGGLGDLCCCRGRREVLAPPAKPGGLRDRTVLAPQVDPDTDSTDIRQGYGTAEVRMRASQEQFLKRNTPRKFCPRNSGLLQNPWRASVRTDHYLMNPSH